MADEVISSDDTSISIDQVFPLPFRICFAIIVGIWGWSLNLRGLQTAQVDTSALLQYSQSGVIEGTIRLAGEISSVLFIGTTIYLLQPPDSVLLDMIPWATMVICFTLLFFVPKNGAHGKKRFVTTFLRIMIGGIDKDNRLPDILVADALTSYSKVLVDFASASRAFLLHQDEVPPNRSGTILIPFVSALPFLIRLRQCYLDWKNTGKPIHLLNWMKYFTSIPMIMMHTLTKNGSSVLSPEQALKFWAFTSFVNSTYSFIWDIRCDWDLSLLGNSTHRHPSGLRTNLYFKPWIYYAAIVVDFGLRFVWVWKYLYNMPDSELGLFFITIIEILRRWMWVFIRVESDWAIVKPKMTSLPLNELSSSTDT